MTQSERARASTGIIWDEETTFPFFEDEDAVGVYGFGHQDKAAFAEAVKRLRLPQRRLGGRRGASWEVRRG